MTQTTTKLPEMLLWLDANRGQYIPQVFANNLTDRSAIQGVTENDWVVLQEGPDGLSDNPDLYWETWSDVLDDAVITYNGVAYFLYQDGDLWLVPCGMEWDVENETFVWPNERTEGEAV